MSRIVWAPDALEELAGATGLVTVEDDTLAERLIEADRVQVFPQGPEALRPISARGYATRTMAAAPVPAPAPAPAPAEPDDEGGGDEPDDPDALEAGRARVAARRRRTRG
jgi:hypothetical protein